MKCYKDALNGDLLVKGDFPMTLVDDFIYELKVDFPLHDHLEKKAAVDSYDEFMTLHGVRMYELMANKTNQEAFNPESMAFAGKYMTWVMSLFEDEERAKKLEFWSGKSKDGQICFVETRGDGKVLMLLKDATTIE